MALPTNGAITMYQVKQEFVPDTGLEFKLEDLRTVSTGGKEVKIGGVWRTLNPCSPVSPSAVTPFYLSDWYGYNHAAVCCEPPRKVVIRPYNNTYPIVTSLVLQIPSGGGNVGLGFYLLWEGSALDVVITWSISWFGGLDSGQGTAAITATFNSAMTYYSFVKATVTNRCGTSESQVIAVSFEGGGGVCTPPSNVVITRNSSTAPISLIANTPTNLVFNTTFSGTSSGATYLWQAWGEQNIVPDSTNPANATASFNMAAGSQGWVKCTVSNNCGTVVSNVIGVSVGGGGTFYGNQPQTFSITKTCPPGETGSTHTKSIAENTYYAATVGDANILAYNAARDAATNEMNSIGSCTPSGTCPVNLSSVSISVSPTTIILGQSTTITVLLSVVGSGIVGIFVDGVYGATTYSTHNVINGNNTIILSSTPSSTVISNTYYVVVHVELINKGNCTNTNLTSNTVVLTVTSGCNPNIWRFIGNPYCIGTTQKQVRENQCGTQEEVTIENNSPACIIGSTKDYSKISVIVFNDSFRTIFQISNFAGSGGTVKLRYCTGSSFICSFAPPTSDFTIAEGLASFYSEGRWNIGEPITFRIWFDGVAGFEDKTVIVQNS